MGEKSFVPGLLYFEYRASLSGRTVGAYFSSRVSVAWLRAVTCDGITGGS